MRAHLRVGGCGGCPKLIYSPDAIEVIGMVAAGVFQLVFSVLAPLHRTSQGFGGVGPVSPDLLALERIEALQRCRSRRVRARGRRSPL